MSNHLLWHSCRDCAWHAVNEGIRYDMPINFWRVYRIWLWSLPQNSCKHHPSQSIGNSHCKNSIKQGGNSHQSWETRSVKVVFTSRRQAAPFNIMWEQEWYTILLCWISTHKRQCLQEKTEFSNVISTNMLLLTSCVVERLFSQTKRCQLHDTATTLDQASMLFSIKTESFGIC